MRVLVCGGRDFDDWILLDIVLEKIQTELCLQDGYVPSSTIIIEGGAIGADFLARCWAKSWGLKYEEYPAEWKKYGKSAGLIRNRQMLDEGKPDLVVAFPGGRGTNHMIGIAKEAGIKVIEVQGEKQ